MVLALVMVFLFGLGACAMHPRVQTAVNDVLVEFCNKTKTADELLSFVLSESVFDRALDLWAESIEQAKAAPDNSWMARYREPGAWFELANRAVRRAAYEVAFGKDYNEVIFQRCDNGLVIDVAGDHFGGYVHEVLRSTVIWYFSDPERLQAFYNENRGMILRAIGQHELVVPGYQMLGAIKPYFVPDFTDSKVKHLQARFGASVDLAKQNADAADAAERLENANYLLRMAGVTDWEIYAYEWAGRRWLQRNGGDELLEVYQGIIDDLYRELTTYPTIVE